jgi:uroporphyrinogen decarboxylase
MPKPMTSRERVFHTINHQEPDRVPFDLSLTIGIYSSLRNYLSLPDEPAKTIGLWTDVSPSLDLLDAMQTDFYHLSLSKLPNPFFEKNSLTYDEWGIGRKKVIRSDGSYYYELQDMPLARATLKRIEDYSWPDPYDPRRIQGLRKHLNSLCQHDDKAVMAKFSNSIWEQSWWMYGLQDWMIDLIDKPSVPNALMKKLTDIAIGFAEVGIHEIGERIDILRLSGEDLGTQTGPMISKSLYEEMVKPHFQRYWGTIRKLLKRKNPQAKIQLHSCGNIRPFISDWIEMGLDILEPIQPNVIGMEPEGLKKDFGESLTFFGGIDLQRLLPFEDRNSVIEGVKDYMHCLGKGGGYVVAPAHNVQNDVPPENLVAIRDAIRLHGCYPLSSKIEKSRGRPLPSAGH